MVYSSMFMKMICKRKFTTKKAPTKTAKKSTIAITVDIKKSQKSKTMALITNIVQNALLLLSPKNILANGPRTNIDICIDTKASMNIAVDIERNSSLLA